MRDSSYKSSKQTTQQIPFQGGEKKVMKKSLSLLLALAMVFGLFASMASAADTELTTAQKLQQLVDKGVLKGKPDGLPHLEDNLSRAEFATIAIAIAGIAPSTSTSSAFKDVKAGQWWTPAIQAAYEAGLVNGVGNSLFSPKANVTVESLIKVAVTIAKLTPVEGATVSGSSAWAGPYIQAAIDAGLPIPTNYKANATRGQTIDLAYTVFQGAQVKPLTDVKAVLNADDTVTVTGVTYGADSVKVSVDTDAAVAATLKEDGSFTLTTTALKTTGDHKITVQALKGTTVLASVEKTVNVLTFAVDSVSYVNGKTLKVKFTKAVQDAVTTNGGRNTGNYVLHLTGGDVTPVAVTLSDDKSEANLVFAGGLVGSDKDRYIQLTVKSDLKSAAGTSLPAFKGPVLLTDSVAPTATVAYTSPNIVITFSEPVQDNVGSVSVDGSVYTLTAVNKTYDNTRAPQDTVTGVTVIKINNTTAGSHRVDLIGFKDLYGNLLPDFNASVSVAADTVAPAVASVTSEGSNLRIKFTEAVVANATGKIGTVTVGTTPYDILPANATDSTNTEFLVNVVSYLPANSNFAYGSVVVAAGYKDNSGNQGTASSAVTLLITKDTTAPTVVSTSYVNNLIVVKFSEKVQVGTIPATLKVRYVSSDNILKEVDATIGGASFNYDVNGNGIQDAGEDAYVAITVTDARLITTSGTQSYLLGGTWNVTLPANFVLDTGSNGNAQATLAFTASGSTSANAAISATYPATVTNGTFTVVFGGTTALSDSALNPNNYTINGTPLPADAKLTFVNDKLNVRVTLPDSYVYATGNRTLAVRNIVDTNGNTLLQAAIDGRLVEFKENVKPAVKSVGLVNGNAVSVTFTEAVTIDVTSTDYKTGFELTINGVKQDLTKAEWTITSNPADSTQLIISTTTNNTFAPGQQVSVKLTSVSSVKDINANVVADGAVNLNI
jgi:S-layer homology domain.